MPEPFRQPSVVRWAASRTRARLSGFVLGGLALSVVSVLASAAMVLPSDPTLSQRITNGLVSALGAIVVVMALGFAYALIAAPYEQRNAARQEIALHEEREAQRGSLDVDVRTRFVERVEGPPNEAWDISLDLENRSPVGETLLLTTGEIFGVDHPLGRYGDLNLQWANHTGRELHVAGQTTEVIRLAWVRRGFIAFYAVEHGQSMKGGAMPVHADGAYFDIKVSSISAPAKQARWFRLVITTDPVAVWNETADEPLVS